MERRQLVAIILGFVAVSIPGLIQWQTSLDVAPGTLLGVAALGGGVAGRLLVPPGERIRAHLLAMAAGVIAAVGAFVLMRWWLAGRSSVWNAELALVTAIGSLPGVLIGTLGYQKLRRRDDPVPAAVARERRE